MRIRLWISICLIALLLTSCVRIFIPEKAEEPEEKVLDFTKKTHNYSQGTPEDYICTVLDEGVLELIDYSDKEAYFTGHEQKWKFKIIGEGTVRLLWEHVDGTLILNRYTETYTFDADGNYTMEYDCMVQGIKYILYHKDDESRTIQGYFADFNGKLHFYSVESELLNGRGIDDVYSYLLENFEAFEAVATISREALSESYMDLQSVPEVEGIIKDEVTELYGVTLIGETKIRYALIATQSDEDTCYCSEEALKIIKVFGDDWAKYTLD